MNDHTHTMQLNTLQYVPDVFIIVSIFPQLTGDRDILELGLKMFEFLAMSINDNN
jgi:hypothetical protein